MSLSRRRFSLGAIAFVTALLSTTAQTRLGEPLIRICLDSLHANYTAVTNALTIRLTQDAAHNANIKVITAVDPITRTGDLAHIDRGNLGEGVFKDEYVGWQDFQMRGAPLLGQGPYSGEVWYIRPRVTYASGTGTPTRVTSYGDSSGKTYGDAMAGPKGYQDLKTSITGKVRIYICGEHIIGTEDIRVGDGSITGVGNILIDQSGDSADARTELRYDYPNIVHNGHVLDRGVYWGGLMINDTTKSWTSNVVALPYNTVTTTIAAGARGSAITMDTDGDTGTVLDFDGSTIWVSTDGTAGNSFDNSPTSNDTFTIAGGNGAASQNGAATSVSNIYVHPDRPSSAGSGAWFRDPGSAFGNPVGLAGYEKFTGLAGTVREFDLTVSTADGGVELTVVDTIAECISTADTVYKVDGNSDPVVVHIVGGADPTNRIMSYGFGVRVGFGETVDNVLSYGERCRLFHNTDSGIVTRYLGRNNFRMEDFSRKFGDSGPLFQEDITLLTADRTNREYINGYCGRAGSAIYPGRGQDEVYLIDGLTVHDFVAQQIGGNQEGNADGHGVGSEGNSKGIDIRRFIGRNCGGDINLYQKGNWVTYPSQHEWGAPFLQDIDIDGVSTGFTGVSGDASNVGIHFAGDNDDEADIGNAGASPRTDQQDFAPVVQYFKITGKRNNIRVKSRDQFADFSDGWLDNAGVTDIAFAGEDPDDNRQARAKFRRIEFGETTPSPLFVNITNDDTGDWAIDIDDSTYHAALADLKFKTTAGGTVSGTNWKAKSRTDSAFDPNSTWTG